jgi:positive regulator of sigma E activity
MYSSLLRELLSVLILLIIINSTLLKFHNVTTLALDNIASLVKNTLFYYLVKFLSLLLGQVLFNFIFRNSLSAVLIRTRGTLTLGIMFIYMIN